MKRKCGRKQTVVYLEEENACKDRGEGHCQRSVGRGGVAASEVEFSVNLRRGMVAVAGCLLARCIKTGSDSDTTEM